MLNKPSLENIFSPTNEILKKTRLGYNSQIGSKQRSPDSVWNQGSDLRLAATYSPTLIAVPSALTGLTSLFGMGRGGTPSLKPPKSFGALTQPIIVLTYRKKQK